jgi:hypothetical protein
MKILCSCIVCHEVKSTKGIHSHFLIAHDTEYSKKHQKNSILGNSSSQNSRISEHLKRTEKYSLTPNKCEHCDDILSYKSRRNKYCSTTCAAYATNSKKDWSKIKTGPESKPKQTKAPYSTLFKCVCKHCGKEWRDRSRKLICNGHNHLYGYVGRSRYCFQFNVFNYPDLFDLTLITSYGFRDSKTNPNGITRDHRVSVNESIKNNHDPYYIKHPMNCELMFFKDNHKKGIKSSISYDELVCLVNDYDSMVVKKALEASHSSL